MVGAFLKGSAFTRGGAVTFTSGPFTAAPSCVSEAAVAGNCVRVRLPQVTQPCQQCACANVCEEERQL